MYNSTVFVVYIPFLLISGYVFVAELVRSMNNRSNIMLAFMAFSVLGWNASLVAVLFIRDIPTNIFIWNLAIVFVNFATTAKFLFVYKVFRPERKIAKPIAAILFIVPIVNVIISLSPMSHLMRESEIISLYPVHEVVYSWGPWFWIHTTYSYALAVATIITLIRGHISKPRFYRLASSLVAIGVAVTLIGNLLVLSGIPPTILDLTAIMAAVSALFFHLAISTNDHSLYSRYARSKVFNFIDDYVLVLGAGGHVSDFNPSANRWFSSLGIDLRTTTLDSLLKILTQKGATIGESLDDEAGRDIIITDNGFPLVLNMRIHEMVDEKLYKHGSIAFFSNVTQSRMLLKRLEKEAGMDSLTGLPNRIAYDGAKVRYDVEEHMPLSVIVCDVNGLKEVNDTLGHNYGDMLLQTASEILIEVCEKQHFVARIGGDEFLFLLSNMKEDYAEDLIKRIKRMVANYTYLPFKLSMAMGMATKHEIHESLVDVIALADNRMYEDKKQMKERDK
ncbi:MAG: diguanylate cyclase [Defluviitaleaceae bacterium]|nr:diguanylate cyclase [Defluviitaleaceae bacterium]